MVYTVYNCIILAMFFFFNQGMKNVLMDIPHFVFAVLSLNFPLKYSPFLFYSQLAFNGIFQQIYISNWIES